MVKMFDPGNGIHDEETWLKARVSGLGASEASAVLGLNPYMSNVDLWRIKTGRKKAANISSDAHVAYGHNAEGPIRELFALDYPEYDVSYGGAFDMVSSEAHPWAFATLDGRLVERATGRKGVLEIKTTEILRSMQKEKWRDKIPDNYFVQVLHQLLVTGWDFAILHAQLKRVWDGEIKTERRSYLIEREDVLEDIKILEDAEIKFWRMVQEDRQPDLILPEI